MYENVRVFDNEKCMAKARPEMEEYYVISDVRTLKNFRERIVLMAVKSVEYSEFLIKEKNSFNYNFSF